MTQRKPKIQLYFISSASSLAQPMHPLADYARKQLKYETVRRSAARKALFLGNLPNIQPRNRPLAKNKP